MNNERGIVSLGFLCISVLAIMLMREKHKEGPEAFNKHMRKAFTSRPLSFIPEPESKIKLPKELRSHTRSHIYGRVEEEIAKIKARTGQKHINVHQQAEIVSKLVREAPFPTKAQMDAIYQQHLAAAGR